MKHVLALFIIGGLLCGPAVIWAAPFLVCDPMVADVVGFELEGLGASAIASTPVTNGDGTKSLHHDLASLAPGTYTVRARANYGPWGWSALSAPFTFTKPASPGPPINLRLSSQ